MIGCVGGSGVLVTGRAIDGRLARGIVKGQRRCYTCPGWGAEAGGELGGPLWRPPEGRHDVVHAEALRRGLAVLVLVVLGAVHADGPVGAVGAPAGHAAAVRALDFGHGAQRGRVGLRRRDGPVLSLYILDPHGLGALHRLLLVPALLPRRHVLLQPLFFLLQHVLLLEPPPPPQEAPVFEHVIRVRVQGPIAALSGFLIVAGHLDKTLVEGQIVPDAVLPALLVVSVKGKPLHDKLVNPIQGHLLVRRVLDSHGDERDVAVGGFDHILGLRLRGVRSIRPGHAGGVLVVSRVRVHVHRRRHPGVSPTGSGPVVARVAADVRHDAQRVGTGDGVASLHVFTLIRLQICFLKRKAPKDAAPLLPPLKAQAEIYLNKKKKKKEKKRKGEKSLSNSAACWISQQCFKPSPSLCLYETHIEKVLNFGHP